MTDGPCSDGKTIRAALLERIIAIMKMSNPSSYPYAVIDHKTCRILMVGVGPHETHLPLEMIKVHPHQYAIIPGREQIETIGLIRDFILRRFTDGDLARGAAMTSLNRSSSSSEWRGGLGEHHEVVVAFDAYMAEFRAVIAEMLVHETSIPESGI
jgi:hypothetical protein